MGPWPPIAIANYQIAVTFAEYDERLATLCDVERVYGALEENQTRISQADTRRLTYRTITGETTRTVVLRQEFPCVIPARPICMTLCCVTSIANGKIICPLARSRNYEVPRNLVVLACITVASRRRPRRRPQRPRIQFPWISTPVSQSSIYGDACCMPGSASGAKVPIFKRRRVVSIQWAMGPVPLDPLRGSRPCIRYLNQNIGIDIHNLHIVELGEHTLYWGQWARTMA